MIKLKSGITFAGLSPQIVLAISIAGSIYVKYGIVCVVTSLEDGKHSKTSLHYHGLAVDLRTRNIPQDSLLPLVNELKIALNENYDVVLEKDHIHIEYDPD